MERVRESETERERDKIEQDSKRERVGMYVPKIRGGRLILHVVTYAKWGTGDEPRTRRAALGHGRTK